MATLYETHNQDSSVYFHFGITLAGLAGTHKTTSPFTTLLRHLVALTIIYITVYPHHWLHSTGIVIDKRCLRNFVLWTGDPANITPDTAQNLELLWSRDPYR